MNGLFSTESEECTNTGQKNLWLYSSNCLNHSEGHQNSVP